MPSGSAFFNKHRSEVLKHRVVYFADPPKNQLNPWGGSKKLNDTYWGQEFIRYIFPEKKLTAVYQFEHPQKPKDAFVVKSLKLLPY